MSAASKKRAQLTIGGAMTRRSHVQTSTYESRSKPGCRLKGTSRCNCQGRRHCVAAGERVQAHPEAMATGLSLLSWFGGARGVATVDVRSRPRDRPVHGVPYPTPGEIRLEEFVRPLGIAPHRLANGDRRTSTPLARREPRGRGSLGSGEVGLPHAAAFAARAADGSQLERRRRARPRPARARPASAREAGSGTVPPPLPTMMSMDVRASSAPAASKAAR